MKSIVLFVVLGLFSTCALDIINPCLLNDCVISPPIAPIELPQFEIIPCESAGDCQLDISCPTSAIPQTCLGTTDQQGACFASFTNCTSNSDCCPDQECPKTFSDWRFCLP